jgi:hypothetical protein
MQAPGKIFPVRERRSVKNRIVQRRGKKKKECFESSVGFIKGLGSVGGTLSSDKIPFSLSFLAPRLLLPAPTLRLTRISLFVTDERNKVRALPLAGFFLANYMKLLL